MRHGAPFALLLLCLSACKPAEEGRAKAIIGAVLIDGAGGPPVTDSVVIVSGGLIRAAGARSNIPIPAEADKINGAGRFLVPDLVDVCDRAEPAGTIRAETPEEARAQVAELAGRKAGIIHIGQDAPAAVQAALEGARDAAIRVAGHVSTQAGARLLADRGAAFLVGMIRDTEDLDPALLTRLRDLRTVVAPALAQSGDRLPIASRNTRRMFQAGVRLGLASMGADAVHEAELMVAAGVPPLDGIVAISHNSAMALGQLDHRGTIEPGKRADLLLVSANPGEDIANLRWVVLRMAAGDLVK